MSLRCPVQRATWRRTGALPSWSARSAIRRSIIASGSTRHWRINRLPGSRPTYVRRGCRNYRNPLARYAAMGGTRSLAACRAESNHQPGSAPAAKHTPIATCPYFRVSPNGAPHRTGNLFRNEQGIMYLNREIYRTDHFPLQTRTYTTFYYSVIVIFKNKMIEYD